ncbi:hypothetical protein [Sphingomonas aracearum]|uniref:hypothetical protein n=1 Tax=Sphingomonas aracearum TaxID=2283317 RepID=UPI0011C0842B|nr:hypothetical protein [Sphingomonas aracearum]
MILATATQQADARPPAPAPSATNAPSDEQRIAQSASLGRLLYTFDRAAWVSSDALTDTVPKDRLTGIGGYVVEPSDAQTLRVTYYRGSAAAAQAFFVAEVREGKVVRKELLATPVALTAAQVRLARAREVAADRARERSYKPCTPVPFNTVVLPSRDDGPVAVYLLSAQQDAKTYPMGGNYRVIVGPDGKVLASRPYSVSCLNLTVPQLPAGAKPVGFMVNHLLDPVPTELHVLASYHLRMPVFVTTPDKRSWQVQGSSIRQAAPK